MELIPEQILVEVAIISERNTEEEEGYSH